MIEQDEKTPVKPTMTTLEQILHDVGEVRQVVEKIATNQLELHETVKDHGKRLTSLERERRLPQIALFLVALVAIVRSFTH